MITAVQETEVEIWADIIGYEGRYQVSSFGRVKSVSRVVDSGNGAKRNITECILTPDIHKQGYLNVHIRKNGRKLKRYSIHRLVAIAFIPNPQNKPTVNHIDTDKSNNNKSNLEWSTSAEQVKHALDNGLFKIKRPSINKFVEPNNNPRNKAVLQFDMHGVLVNEFCSAKHASDSTGFRKECINTCCRGLRNHHRFFIWKYKTANLALDSLKHLIPPTPPTPGDSRIKN